MKRSTFGAALACTVVLLAATVVPAWSALHRSPTSTSAGLRVVQRNSEWGISCGGDTCMGLVVDPLIADTPPGLAGPLDVVVTLTLDFRTSPSDVGLVRLRYRQDGGPWGSMPPAIYPLSSLRRSSTTLTWTFRGLSGAGASYEIEPVFTIRDGGRYGYSFGGRHLVMVAEFWE